MILWNPSQKGVLDRPHTVRFPPRSGVSALFFLYKIPRQSRPEALLSRPSKWTRRVWVANCCWPRRRPSENPEKQPVGTVTASHKILTLQALSSSLNSGTGKRGCLSRGKAFESPPAVRPPERPRPFARYRFWRGPKIFGRARSLVPHTFCTPPFPQDPSSLAGARAATPNCSPTLLSQWALAAWTTVW